MYQQFISEGGVGRTGISFNRVFHKTVTLRDVVIQSSRRSRVGLSTSTYVYCLLKFIAVYGNTFVKMPKLARLTTFQVKYLRDDNDALLSC